jgi:ADP-dependent NAD(P)H-hydrate dehydratase / NAD(P)H-hydrate epimerase
MKILSAEETRKADAFTISEEPIASINLMERAAMELTDALLRMNRKGSRWIVFAGPGNNGADALAVARLLRSEKEQVECYLVTLPHQPVSPDCDTNRKRWEAVTGAPIQCVQTSDQLPPIKEGSIVVDGLFGSGINRPLVGIFAHCVQHINASAALVYSLDIPSGLFSGNNCCNDPKSVIRATHTLTLQLPKEAFMYAENSRFTGSWDIVDIRLHPDAISKAETDLYYTTQEDLRCLLHHRNTFDHKGTYGHALLIAGSNGKAGAAVLAAKAAMRSGVGKLTVHTPSCAYTIMQISVPEAMVAYDSNEKCVASFIETTPYSAIGIGPGIDTYPLTANVLEHLLHRCDKPMVIDADALNLIAANQTWLKLIPPHSILTPHPKEFDRLAGDSFSTRQRIEKAIELATEHQLYIVLKGAYTAIVTPEGSCHFNSTGNPGMATAGSGDVLTGIILSLLAQGYEPKEAALLGVWLHGFAGDCAAKVHTQEGMIASDIIDHLSDAFRSLKGND